MARFKDLTGMKFNFLTVVKFDKDLYDEHMNQLLKGKRKYVKRYWICQCDCGNFKSILGESLTIDTTKSCGCWNDKQRKVSQKKFNKYDLSGEFGIGYTTKGEEFYFDLEDYDLIKNYCWYLHSDGYLYCNHKILHKIITHTDGNIMIDHINRKRNDCRKVNLRVATPMENSRNASLRKDNSSGFTGVYKCRNTWCSEIRVNKVLLRLGYFKTKEEAIIARLKAEKEYFGEFAPQKHLFKKYNI